MFPVRDSSCRTLIACCVSVCVSVCLSADISLNCANNDERILLQFCGHVGCHYATNVSNFEYEPFKFGVTHGMFLSHRLVCLLFRPRHQPVLAVTHLFSQYRDRTPGVWPHVTLHGPHDDHLHDGRKLLPAANTAHIPNTHVTISLPNMFYKLVVLAAE